MKKYRYFHIYDPEKIANLCPDKRQIAAMEDWVQNQSERIKRRFARFKERVEYYWRLYPWLMCAVASVVLISCRSQQIIMPNDTVTQTTTKTKTIQRDSIYLHDSIYIREYIQGDTVFRDKLVEHFKDRWLTRIDTLTQRDTTTVYKPVEVIKEVKHVPSFYKWCTLLLWLLVVGKIIKIIIKFLK